MSSRAIRFETLIPILKGQRLEDEAPIDGRIKQILISWEDGCNNLVNVAAGINHSGNEKWLIPSASRVYLALNDARPLFEADEPVIRGDTLWAMLENGDEVNKHKITVVFNIVGES